MTLSPIVFAQQGGQFLDAARREFTLAGPGISVPAYFMVARAIELTLKSFLLLKGEGEPQLRRIGHDLTRALKEARRVGLDEIAPLEPEAEAALEMVNAYYTEKDLEYLTTGYKSYPQASYLLSCADFLLDRVSPLLRTWRP